MKLLRIYYLVLLLLIICWSSLAFASPKTIIAEATYIMGDGEIPTFAESMVLQKAKRYAIEEAGTYIESYSKIENFKLTRDEVKVLAGGVLKVEILEKKRTIIGEVVQFYVKINAVVSTDNLENLAKNVKSKHIGVEYKQLQMEFEELFKELTEIKNQLSNAKSESDRAKALERIKYYEAQFNSIKDHEKRIYSRLITTDSVLDAINQKQSQIKIAYALIDKIVNGIHIDVGKPEIILNPDTQSIRHEQLLQKYSKNKQHYYYFLKPLTEQEIANMTIVSIPLTMSHSDKVWKDIDSEIMTIGGRKKNIELVDGAWKKIGRGIVFQIGENYETIMAFQKNIQRLLITIEFFSNEGLIDRCQIEPESSAYGRFDGFPAIRIRSLAQGKFVFNTDLNKGSMLCESTSASYCKFDSEEYVLILDRPIIINAKLYMRLEDVKSLQKVNAAIKQLEPQDKQTMADWKKCLQW